MPITRRRLLTTTLSAAAVSTGAAGPALAAPPRLTLPEPTGPYPIGTVPLHLVDRSRPDPFTGEPGHRELMAAAWYPARDTGSHRRASWMDPAVLRRYLADAGYDPDVVRAPLTAGRLGAPVRRAAHRLPLIVFSHGAGDHRGSNTIMVQELASHGYAVVAIDHLGDAYSRLPDGRVVVPTEESLYPEDFALDVRFVLDRLGDLPAGLAGAVDPHRVGMAGWSKGATATARVMLADRRVRAGLAIDGPMLPLMEGRIDRPFMMMTAEFTKATEPAVARFWSSQLTGWRLDVRADGAVHSSYNDLQVLMPQLARVAGMTDEELHGWIGTLAPARAVRIDRAYPLAFFDEHLRGRPQRLLDGPSRKFPEVRYLR
ncbi:hypothetical protein Ade02nite_69520 [Paractinoplanes deccanensis]|uniref:Serine aminopeptidase S33 domain-containing protein n=1 Tax=Paractinoplanes deccanensis TaxID=113561 RepID=A0ABQ3YE99_9ACTN|nr:alpha/beta hydrolase [Actinoplanes deccanensis]GID78311.1 hypothetical protein Ade02nite_69520 [Actinoplanes deccanensis]